MYVQLFTENCLDFWWLSQDDVVDSSQVAFDVSLLPGGVVTLSAFELLFNAALVAHVLVS